MIPIPKIPNEETRLDAARETAQLLMDQTEVQGDIEEIAADVAKHCRFGDGFQMAKDLERAHWDCDMSIAEVLDGHSMRVESAHEKFLTQFQQAHDIHAPFPVGCAVKTSRGKGVIDRIYEHRPMTYVIEMDGDAAAAFPTNRRTLLYFDEVEAA